jgi:hypothetical protein
VVTLIVGGGLETTDEIFLIFNIFKEEEEDAGSWCSDQQEGEFEAFSGDEEEDEGLEPKSLDTHSETEDEAGSAPPEVVVAAGSAPPEVVAAASTLERKCGEKRVEFRLPSAEKEEEEGEGRLAREEGGGRLARESSAEGRGRLARDSSAEKEAGRRQIARIFSEGGLLEELRYVVLFVLSRSKLIGRYTMRGSSLFT